MATIGHVHLKVRDLEEAAAFYTRFLGLRVTERVGSRYTFLTAGERHHDVALQCIGPDAPLPTGRAVGLYHTAFEVADTYAFAKTYRDLMQAGVPVTLTDHRISWAMYLCDPSGNGVEVYCDTREEADGAALWWGADRPLTGTQVMAVLNADDAE